MAFNGGLFDIVGKGLGSASKVAMMAIPDHIRNQLHARASDFNPFMVIAGNHDLIRGVRIAWVEASLEILEVAEDCANTHINARQRDEILHFTQFARHTLYEVRHDALDRRDHPRSSPIDDHVRSVIEGTSEFIVVSENHAPDSKLTTTFSATLEKLTGWNHSPPIFQHIAVRGLPVLGKGPSRSFDQLVFSAFAELLKDPKKYPQLNPAFQTDLANGTRQLVSAVLEAAQDIDHKLNTLIAQVDTLALFQDGSEEFLVNLPVLLQGQQRIEALASLLPDMYLKVDAIDGGVKGIQTTLANQGKQLDRIERQHVRSPVRWHWPQAWDFSLFLEEKRHGYVGREWLFEGIQQWLTAGREQMLLIQAEYGVGKSAFVGAYVHACANGTVIAHHCCQHDTHATLDPAQFVTSIAAQIAQVLPAYAQIVESEPELQNALDLANEDAASAFERALLAPLNRITPADNKPRVLVIDALDESLEFDGSQGRQKTRHIVDLLATRTRRLPSWIRVVATTRARGEIVKAITNNVAIHVIDAENDNNIHDLRNFIHERLAQSQLSAVLGALHVPVQAFAEELIHKAQGKFIYAVHVLNDLEGGQLTRQKIIHLPSGMEGFYSDAFARRFVGSNYAETAGLLGVLAVAQGPMTRADLSAILGLKEAQVQATLQRVRDFLRFANQRWSFGHTSLPEWLAGEDAEGNPRAGQFAIDLNHARQRFRDWAITIVGLARAHDNQYLLYNLAAHLDKCELGQVFGKLLLDFRWLQQRLATAGFQSLLADFKHVHAERGDSTIAQLKAVLQQAGHVISQPDGAAQLATQLLARTPRQWYTHLLYASVPTITSRPWLRPLQPSLQADSGALLHTLRTDAKYVCQLLLSDGRLASAGSDDGSIQLWDLERGELSATLSEHTGRVNALAELSDGRLASGSSDKTIKLWDVRRDALSASLMHGSGVSNLLALPDGRLASSSTTAWTVSDGVASDPFDIQDFTIKLWDVQRGVLSMTLEGHHNVIEVLTLLPDGRLASGSYDNSVKLWDITCGELAATLDGHSSYVRVLTALPDGRLASGTSDHTIKLWDVRRGELSATLRGHERGGVSSLIVLADGRLASGSSDGTINLWDVQHCEISAKLKGHAWGVHVLAVLPDGRLASGADDSSIMLWDVERGEVSAALPGHINCVRALTVLPNGNLASGSWDSTIKLWDVKRGELMARAEGMSGRWSAFGQAKSVTVLSMLPDGRMASGATDGIIKLWDVKLGELRATLCAHDDAVTRLAVLPDGRLASASDDGTIKLWDVQSGKLSATLHGHMHAVRGALVVLPDGRLASTSWDKTIRLWDVKRDELSATLEGHSDWVNALAVLPDGRLASGSSDSTVKLWDLQRGELSATLRGPSSKVWSLAVWPDGRLASGSDDGIIQVWDVERGELSEALYESRDWMDTVFVLSGRRLAVAAEDWSLKLWDIQATVPRELATFTADGPITRIAVESDVIVAGDAKGQVHFLRLED